MLPAQGVYVCTPGRHEGNYVYSGEAMPTTFWTGSATEVGLKFGDLMLALEGEIEAGIQGGWRLIARCWPQVPNGKSAFDDDDDVAAGEGGEEGEVDGQGEGLGQGGTAGKRKGRTVSRPQSYMSLLGTNIVEAFNRLVDELVHKIGHIGWEKAELKLNYLVFTFNLKQLRRMKPDQYKKRSWEPDWAMLLPGGVLGDLPTTEEKFGAHYYWAQAAREAANPNCIKEAYKVRLENWRTERREKLGELTDPWVACDGCTKWRRLPVAQKSLLYECAGDDGRQFKCSMIPGGTCRAPEEEWDQEAFQVVFASSHLLATTSHAACL